MHIRQNVVVANPSGEFTTHSAQTYHQNTCKVRATAKRCFDVIVASTVLLAFSPIMLIIALAIIIEGRGSILFSQQRTGKNCLPFAFYKFRSMVPHNTPSTKLDYVRDNDPRITKVGGFLRKTSLDELPQLFNVLKGDMSLVGPRPQPVCHLEHYGTKIDNYALRHVVRPGITGLVQISPLRDADEHFEDLVKRVNLDLHYVSNFSLEQDIRILLTTALKVIHRAQRLLQK
jgi:lipopolysaccharide/colanic/teichoic acid biosynthesis glycosyltransferase